MRFRRKVADYAPGIEIQDKDMELQFPEVWQAFTVLSDPEARLAYDKALPAPVSTVSPEQVTEPGPQTLRTRMATFFSYAGFILLMIMAVLFLYVLAGYSL